MTAPLLSLFFVLSAAPGAPQSPPPPASAACTPKDAELLSALVAVFEPVPIEIRVMRIENLGLLGDARALDALAALALDEDQQLARAAVRAVGSLSTPRAEEILSNVVRHPRLTQSLKKDALEQLAHQRRASARAFLADIAQNRAYTVFLQHAAQTALQQWGPPPEASSRSQP